MPQSEDRNSQTYYVLYVALYSSVASVSYANFEPHVSYQPVLATVHNLLTSRF